MPDTPITQVVNGFTPYLQAETTVGSPIINADVDLTASAIAADKILDTSIQDGGLQDQPPTVRANNL